MKRRGDCSLEVICIAIALAIVLPLVLPYISEQVTEYQKSTDIKTIEGVVSKIEIDHSLDPKETMVTFADGRTKTFFGQSDKPVEVGKYYVFTYNGKKRIVEVTIKNP